MNSRRSSDVEEQKGSHEFTLFLFPAAGHLRLSSLRASVRLAKLVHSDGRKGRAIESSQTLFKLQSRLLAVFCTLPNFDSLKLSKLTSPPFNRIRPVESQRQSMSVTSSFDSSPRQLPRKPSSLRPADLSSLSLDQSLSEVPTVFIRDVLKDLGMLSILPEHARS